MNTAAIQVGKGNHPVQTEGAETTSGDSGLTDAKLRSMPAPAYVNNLQWQLAGLQERREMLAGGGNDAAAAGVEAEDASPLALLGRTAQQRFRSAQTEVIPGSSVAETVGDGKEQGALDDITSRFKQRFAGIAGDKEAFHDLMRKTYGDSYDATTAEGLRQKSLNGDFSWLPKVELVSAASLTDVSGTQGSGEALGAYSKDNDTVYLSRELLASDPAKAEKILTEEIGHAIDARVNVKDAKGDEGDLFARQLYGENISAAELKQLKQENDSGVININGKEVEVEYGLFDAIKKFGKKVVDTVKDVGKKVVDTVKDGVEKVGDFVKEKVIEPIKDAGKKAVDFVKDKIIDPVVDGVKKAVKSILTNPIVAKIMAVAQFIPIPIVQLVARGYQIAQGAYTVYQGIKNKSWEMALAGFAGAASGVAKFGSMVGAGNTAFIQGAANLASKAKLAININQAVNNKDWTALAGMLPADGGGILSTLKPYVEKARAGSIAYEAARNGDYLGAIGVGAGLMKDFTGAKGDAVLDMIGDNARTAGAIQKAISSGDYSAAADLIAKEYGDNLNLDPASRERLRQFGQTVENINTAKQLIEDKDYAAAAKLLGDTANSHISNPETRERVEMASQAIQKIDTAVKAFDKGDHAEAIKTATEALGYPLDDKTEQFLVDLQQAAGQLEKARKLADSGEYAKAAQVLINEAKTHVGNSDVRERLEAASETFRLVGEAKSAADDGRYVDAIDAVSKALDRPLDEKTRQFLIKLEKLVEGKIDFPSIDSTQGNSADRLAFVGGAGSLNASAEINTDASLPKGGKRGLSEGEIALARSVFGDTIDYSAVTIYHKSYFPLGLQQNNVAMAPNGNIYFDPAGELYRDDFGSADIHSQALFIHEMTHVWQHQQGINVAVKGLFDRSYNYLPLKADKTFSDYGIEQQGDIVRDYFYLRNGYDLPNKPSLDSYRRLIPFADK